MRDAFTAPFFNYSMDVFERSVLFPDVLRRRGNDYLEQSRRTAPMFWFLTWRFWLIN
jgi:hypothetical protein